MADGRGSDDVFEEDEEERDGGGGVEGRRPSEEEEAMPLDGFGEEGGENEEGPDGAREEDEEGCWLLERE